MQVLREMPVGVHYWIQRQIETAIALNVFDVLLWGAD